MRTSVDWIRHPNAYGFNSLSFASLGVATVGAGEASTSILAGATFPCAYKIVKVGIFLSAIDAVTGDAFNLVVGTGTYTSAAASAPANDNSYAGPLPGGTGVPTNVAVAGNTVFGADVGLTVANIPNLAVSTGGYADLTALLPSNDAVYPADIPLTLRATTNASTGAISLLQLSLLIVPVTLRESWATPANPVDYCTPGTSF